MGDGGGRDPSKQYVIGLCCIWFYSMVFVIVCCRMLYIVAIMWVMVRVGIHQRNMLLDFIVFGFISMLFVIVCCCMLYTVAGMWVMLRVGIHQRNICISAGSDLYAEG